ncbi:hypothetical protein B484DRAFT_446218 [Ochromonadaceae sp. CCMP2298]|nr:hypothetical protein B484DRAFT_446218 [Ochromonadaceae sp. CCMP2298]|mmetsp:Transcript_161/g.326  ORF Transcript_161/g.326 Transcript_161/m.326 type:complete len:215 (-) Transcript_161:247-891(-)
MLKTTTPFKIHDENSCLLPGKAGRTPGKSGLKGLSNDTAKKGLNTGLKSSRKALSNLSTSQVNVRLTTPGPKSKPANQKVSFAVEKTTNSTKEAVKGPIVTSSTKLEASEFYYDFEGFSTEDMLCTRMVEEEDLYDGVMKAAADMKISVNPMAVDFSCGSGIDESECTWNNPELFGLTDYGVSDYGVSDYGDSSKEKTIESAASDFQLMDLSGL